MHTESTPRCFCLLAAGQARSASAAWSPTRALASSLSTGTWTLSKNTARTALILVNGHSNNNESIHSPWETDWEYPGRQAAGCNEFAPADTDNFQTLLKELRAALDQRFPNEHKEISMAVHVDPFVGADGQPVADVSGFVPYFDHINLMTYGKYTSTLQ